jgi:hypothetical protein
MVKKYKGLHIHNVNTKRLPSIHENLNRWTNMNNKIKLPFVFLFFHKMHLPHAFINFYTYEEPNWNFKNNNNQTLKIIFLSIRI